MSRHRRRGLRRQRKGRWLPAIVRAYTIARVQMIRYPSYGVQNTRDGLRAVLVAWLCTPEGLRAYPRPKWWGPYTGRPTVQVREHLVEDLVYHVTRAFEMRTYVEGRRRWSR